MNVSTRDILKNVTTGLALSFLIYFGSTVGDALLKHFDVSFQRTAILDKLGYLFQFDNVTSDLLPLNAPVFG